jgi:flavin reductase (DIM6/NTAB) family NADH-FMN oxidoreductase RutF
MCEGSSDPDVRKGLRMSALETADLRSCLGRFATGVTVVSYLVNGEPRGATVNAFSAVSLEPSLVLVSIARRAKACALLEGAPFCVNVLSASQVGIALTFAGRPRESVSVHWDDGRVAPRLRESHAWLECTPWSSYDGGDHVLYLGEVQHLAVRNSEPLLFYAGDFHRRGDGLDNEGRSLRAVANRANPLHVGALERLAEEFVAGWL